MNLTVSKLSTILDIDLAKILPFRKNNQDNISIEQMLDTFISNRKEKSGMTKACGETATHEKPTNSMRKNISTEEHKRTIMNRINPTLQ